MFHTAQILQVRAQRCCERMPATSEGFSFLTLLAAEAHLTGIGRRLSVTPNSEGSRCRGMNPIVGTVEQSM